MGMNISTRSFTFCLVLMSAAACQSSQGGNEVSGDALGDMQLIWEQGFESGDYAVAKASANGWQYELLQPDSVTATLLVDTAQAYEGSYALRCTLPKRIAGDPSSKAVIAIKQDASGFPFAFTTGNVLRVDMWCYLTASLGKIYVCDVEDSINGNMGMRFYIDTDGSVVCNRDKLGLVPALVGDMAGAKAPFNSWFLLSVEMTIANTDADSVIKASVNGVECFQEAFASVVPSVSAYDTIQIGYTVSQEAGEIWIDQVDIYYSNMPIPVSVSMSDRK